MQLILSIILLAWLEAKERNILFFVFFVYLEELGEQRYRKFWNVEEKITKELLPFWSD